ncbi:MAG: type II secretion system protein N [Burkholderiales bacterium]|nr:type II secretion system protein N [Burkholderiales bacterium]
MKKVKLFICVFAGICFVGGMFVYKLPAWFLGVLTSKYTDNRLLTREETGTFWSGSALLVASDKDNKRNIPLKRIDWQVKLGFKQFIVLNVKNSGNQLATISLQKDGVHVDALSTMLSMEQLVGFANNLSTLGLFGDVSLTGNQIILSKTNKGQINVNLDSVGSAMSPLNPLGSYTVTFNLANSQLDVQSTGGSILEVSGSGNAKSLSLTATVKPDNQDQLLQFMTMMGVPQGNGSYLLKVF